MISPLSLIEKYRKILHSKPLGTTYVDVANRTYLALSSGGYWYIWRFNEWSLAKSRPNYPVQSIEDIELIVKLHDQNAKLQKDSDRWNALLRSPFRLFGHAGLKSGNATEPCDKYGKNGYAHFGCEMWTIHDGYEADGTVLTGFADQRLRYEALEKERKVEEEG